MKPEGAVYGFLHVEGLTDRQGFATALVRPAPVGMFTGSAFVPADANASDRFIRN